MRFKFGMLGMIEMKKNVCKNFSAKVVWQDWIVVEGGRDAGL